MDKLMCVLIEGPERLSNDLETETTLIYCLKLLCTCNIVVHKERY